MDSETSAAGVPVEAAGADASPTAEGGSPAAETAQSGATGEQNGNQQANLIDALKQNPAILDDFLAADPNGFQALMERSPRLRDLYGRHVQSRSDRIVADQLARIQRGEEERRRVEDEKARQRQARQELLSLDPYEAGKKVQGELTEQEQAEALEARVADRYRKEGYEQGFQNAWAEVYQDLADDEDVGPVWRGLSPAEQREFIVGNPRIGRLLTALHRKASGEKLTKAAQAEAEKKIAQLRGTLERDIRAQLRASEPSVDLGDGAVPAGGEADFLAAFASGKSNDMARAKQLLGI